MRLQWLRLCWSVFALVFTVSCARVETNTRTERGALLRTFERSQIVEGGVTGAVSVDWPKLRVNVRGFDTCRQVLIDEYAEDTITERSSSATGPAISTGAANLLASGVLFLASQFVSNAPNVAVIDAGGRYGPSTKQQVEGWGWLSLGIGVPALAVGIVSYLRTGEDVETHKVENITGQKDKTCNERDIDGPIELHFAGLTAIQSQTALLGVAQFDAAEVLGAVEGVSFYGRTLALDEPSQRALDGFNACTQLTHIKVAVESLGVDALTAHVDLLTQCANVKPDVLEQRDAARELLNKKTQSSTLEVHDGPTTFEEAVLTLAPKVVLTADGDVLKTPEKFAGQAARVEGLLNSNFVNDQAVLQVGARRVALQLPTQATWAQGLAAGQRIEAVGTLSGTVTVGKEKLLLVKLLWARPAF